MASSDNSLLSEFQTPSYAGAWFSFHGDRTANRRQIENYLRTKLKDEAGHLIVNEQGPWWEGQVKLAGLSYAHSASSAAGFTILLFSLTHELGVDVESQDRVFQLQPEQIAQRYFHPNEQKAPFLDLWLKKEAYAKATRQGLAKTIHTETAAITQFLFKPLEKVPTGFSSTLCLKGRGHLFV
jgi:hypothetical protein